LQFSMIILNLGLFTRVFPSLIVGMSLSAFFEGSEATFFSIDLSDGEGGREKGYLTRGRWLDGFFGLLDFLLILDGE